MIIDENSFGLGFATCIFMLLIIFIINWFKGINGLRKRVSALEEEQEKNKNKEESHNDI